MKKLCLILALTVLASIAVYAADTDVIDSAYGFGSAPQFDDISHVPWAQEAIKYFSENGIIEQSFDKKLHPDEYVTREEFVHILISAFGLYDQNAKCAFSDVTPKFYGDVASAAALGIVNGVSETEFGFGSNITRQDLSAMSCRVLNHLGIEAASDKLDFNDADKIADYARDSVGVLKAMGILNGDNAYCFNPENFTTRAEAYKIIYLLMLKNA